MSGKTGKRGVWDKLILAQKNQFPSAQIHTNFFLQSFSPIPHILSSAKTYNNFPQTLQLISTHPYFLLLIFNVFPSAKSSTNQLNSPFRSIPHKPNFLSAHFQHKNFTLNSTQTFSIFLQPNSTHSSSAQIQQKNCNKSTLFLEFRSIPKILHPLHSTEAKNSHNKKVTNKSQKRYAEFN